MRCTLSVPVVQAMAQQVNGPIDFGVWGSVVVNLAYANLAREIWLESKLDPHVPTFTTIMQCSTSMVGAFEAAGMLGAAPRGARHGRRRREHDPRPDRLERELVGLAAPHVSGAQRGGSLAHSAPPASVRYPACWCRKCKNRVTGRSMGEHTEDMAKDWNIGRQRAGRARAGRPSARRRGARSRLLQRSDHCRSTASTRTISRAATRRWRSSPD